MMWRFLRAQVDVFTAGILLAAALGILLPCSGVWAEGFFVLTHAAIVLLFFLYGVKLSTASVRDGLLHWRLQLVVAGFTFVFFPLAVCLLQPALEALVGAGLFAGLLYVACLPSTVQSSVAFTSVAGGNVPAAVCAASVSSLLGVLLTPALVGLLFRTGAAAGAGADVGLDTVIKICSEILLPFVLGQLCRPWLSATVAKHRSLIGWNDKTTIWLVVYTSFSTATVQGYWGQLDMLHLGGLLLACALLLGVVMLCTYTAARRLHFCREDVITIVFCGSKKSLAVGAPMMLAIFGSLNNDLLLPLMVFHQVQLMVCARLAAHWRRAGSDDGGY